MKSTYLNSIKVIGLIITGIVISINFVSAQKHDWLEDQPPTDKITITQTNKFTTKTGFPRKSTGSLKNAFITNGALSCFDMVCLKPYPGNVTKLRQTQLINPGLAYLRIYCPQEWQGGADPDNKQVNGYPFNTSGPATANNQIFAGHFAYKPYTTLTTAISSAETSLTVASGTNISNNQYCVIYPSNSWENAEHVLVTAKNGTTLTITRAYKSIAKDWPSGSKIAMHQVGNGTTADNWCYNMSTRCPVDANGKKAWEVFSVWLTNSYDKDDYGNPMSGVTVDGILYDSDAYSFTDGGGVVGRNADFDNDGVSDWGYAPDGTNFWSEGLELFYKGVRDGINARGHTNAVILSGVAESWGVIPNNGTQVEAAWSHNFDPGGGIASGWNHIGFYQSVMKAQTGHGIIGPRVSDVQSKEASALYYGETVETRNSPVRFSYAMSMMYDGTWFSNQNGFGDAFHYFDEDAVYTKGANYGKSVLKSNTTDILANSKWLGNALGHYQRVYNPTSFELSKNLINNGDFESALSGWSGTQASVALDTDKKYEGNSSLKITPVVPNSSSIIDAAKATSPQISLQPGEYSLCVAIYSEAPVRKAQFRILGLSQVLLIPPGWSKHVLCWTETSTATVSLKIDVGGDLTTVWIDQLYVFKDFADVFRRDFENGIILANAGKVGKTITLEKPYQRILGNLDAAVNNGQTITEVTIPAHDGLFLINQTATGMNDLQNNKTLVFPNPVISKLNIKVPDEAISFCIFNMLGKIIMEDNLQSKNDVSIDMSDCNSGIYVLKVSGKSFEYQTKICKH